MINIYNYVTGEYSHQEFIWLIFPSDMRLLDLFSDPFVLVEWNKWKR